MPRGNLRDVALNGEEEEAVVGHCCVAFGGMAMMKPALVDRVCKVLLDVMDLCPESLVIHDVCIARLSRMVGWVSGMVLGLGMDKCFVAIA